MTLDPTRLIDPEVSTAAADVPPQTTWDPLAMRAAGAAILDHETPVPDGLTRTIVTVPSDGEELELRVHAPQHGANAVILSIHGGGFVAGQAKYDDAWNATLALRTGATVVSPNYRLAPESSFPTPLEDCVAAWTWVITQYPEATWIAYGDSAGGNLTAGLTLRCRDTDASMPDHVFLIEPVLDDRLNTASMRNATSTAVWDLPNATASWSAYLGDHEPTSHAAPAREADLSGFPPTFLLANQCDPLMDEDLAFARALTEANVPTEAVLLPGTCHGILGLNGPGVAERARELVLGRLADLIDART
ncbi:MULTISPECIES: alpha/beta hydrolase [Actinomyces]|uniref:Alpha/beta hydrolase n=1 Tax=Actinomyces respiraculi TaxID=2744574 RepID=A0A7T0LLG3_9ACTO|nr:MULTISPECIES: alpha/beta hydrolase [Actinomyces]QPL05941.1 alpha/beta hydrolase [Actinomyces respiraculi]